ncbi:DUF2756 domain-containing protein [Shigella flexneri]
MLPFAVLAQPINTRTTRTSRVVVPSQHRIRTEDAAQQQQQKGMLISS